MSRYAKGVSDRSGFVYRLKDMKKEWTGALVGPDEFEAKHPQLTIRRVPADPKPLRNARPDRREPLFLTVGQRVLNPIPRVLTDAFSNDPGAYDLENDVLRLALYSETLLPSIAEYQTANEISGGGYVAGGEILVDNEAEWLEGGFEFVYGLLYDETLGGASVAVYNFGPTNVFRQGLVVRNVLP